MRSNGFGCLSTNSFLMGSRAAHCALGPNGILHTVHLRSHTSMQTVFALDVQSQAVGAREGATQFHPRPVRRLHLEDDLCSRLHCGASC